MAVVRPLDFSSPENYIDLLRGRISSDPERCIYKYLNDGESQEVSITYTELDQRAREIAAVLQERRAAGKRVLILQRRMPDFIFSFIGCLYAQAVAVPVPYTRSVSSSRSDASFEGVQRVARDSQAEYALTGALSAAELSAAGQQLPELQKLDLLVTDETSPDIAKRWQAPRVDGDTLAYLQYTSGSTQAPRGVMVSHRNLVSNLAYIQNGAQGRPDECVVQWIPLYHDMGLLGVLAATAVGCMTVLIPSFHFVQRPLRWLQAITRYKATFSGGPNFAYDLCVSRIPPEAREHLDLSHWRWAFCGGEPVKHATMRRFADAFGPSGFDFNAFYPCYGLGEYTLKVSGGRPSDSPAVCQFRSHDLCLGRAIQVSDDRGHCEATTLVGCGRLEEEHRALIVDPEKLSTVPEGTVGEIWVQGPSKAAGYWNQPSETKHTFEASLATGEGPFLRTGDLGFFFGNQLFVTGRRKEVIIIHGRNHYPHDVEDTVQACAPVLRRYGGAAFTIGSGNDEKLVVVQEQERAERADHGTLLKSICRAVNEQHALPIGAIALVKGGSIPRTTSGKIQRLLCRELYLNGKLRHVLMEWRAGDDAAPELRGSAAERLVKTWDRGMIGGPAVPRPDARAIEAWIVLRLARVLKRPSDQISVDQSVWDFGLSSVQAIGLTGELGTWLNQDVSPVLLFEYPTIASLAAQLGCGNAFGIKPGQESAVAAEQTVASRQEPSPPRESLDGHALPGERTSHAFVADRLPQLDQGDYGKYSRGELVRHMAAVKLDKTYIEARGDRLWYEADGRRHEVLDLVGGFGATLFGHNHPDLVARQQAILAAAVPLMSQVSIRGHAGTLAKELARRLERSIGKPFVTFLFSTGAEAVEAAIRHAELEYGGRAKEQEDQAAKDMALLLHHHRKHPVCLPDDVRAELGELTGHEASDLAAICSALLKNNAEVFSKPCEYLALEGAFHGKTSGAGSLTFRHHYSDVPRRQNIPVAWVDPSDAQALHKTVGTRLGWIYALKRLNTGEIILRRQRWCRVAAFFVEPIQGEGGVQPVDAGFLAEVRAMADAYQFPVVVDEIQTGMGRCGSFTASERVGLRGDYYILGKSLGGGLAKLSALLVERSRGQDDFGVFHSSTFAEDDHSALIGLKALEVLDRDNLMERANGAGMHLLELLRDLQRCYPTVIADVRGMGGLIGLELASPCASRSAVLRFIDEDLGLVAAGFLLNECGVRMMITLSHPLTIRLEPSAYLSEDDARRAVQGLERLCKIIQFAAAGRLLRYIAVDAQGGSDAMDVRDWRDRHPTVSKVTADRAPKVGFLAYATDTTDMMRWDPSLGDIPTDCLEGLVRALHRLTPPRVAERFLVKSETGETVQLILAGFMMTSSLVEELMRANDLERLRHRIDEAVDLLRDEGCHVVGLGGHLSVISEDCKTAARTDIGLTSGNSLTVAVCCETVRRVCRQQGIDLAKARVAVVGAGGNICSAIARILAWEVSQLILIGRSRMQPSLLALGNQLYEDAWKRLEGAEAGPVTGIARTLRDSADALGVLPAAGRGVDAPGAWLSEQLKHKPEELLPLTLTDDMNRLRGASVVVTGSNSAGRIIFPHHTGDDTAAIFDVAVPRDVSGEVAAQRPDIRVVSAGVVRLPNSQDVDLKLGHLSRGTAYACMAETLLLGLAGHNGHFSFGTINLDEVERIMGMAAKHGFQPDVDTFI